MTQLFLKILNMSIAAGWIVLAVLLLRPVTRKLPKWIHCLLWGIAGLRLVLPFFPVSVISLLPSGAPIPLDLDITATPSVQTGVSTVNKAVNSVLAQQVCENGLAGFLDIAWIIWICGMAALLLYACIATVRLRLKVRVALRQEAGVYLCDDVASPFIFGMVRPKIYIPSDLDPVQQEYVLAHEKAHLRRLDHLWKPIGFLLLTVHWFHPLLWIGYSLLCRDIEQACDEKVISKRDGGWRKRYSETLAACSTHRRLVVFCPVAFGELSVKTRIKGILSYKKPAFWVIAISLVCCSVFAAGFLTDPLPCEHSYECTVTREPSCSQEGVRTFTCTQCQDWYTEPVALLPHSYSNGTVTLQATCTSEGIYQQACRSCGSVCLTPIATVAHTAGDIFLYQEPNCVDHGLLASYCTVCSQLFAVERLTPNGVHDLQETVVTAATCTEEGSGVASCTRCSYSERRIYEKIPHNYVGSEIFRSPYMACSTQGIQTFSCTDCDSLYAVYHSPLGHDIYTAGNGKRYCKICGMCLGKANYDPFGNTNATFTGGSAPSFPVIIWDLNHVIKPGG